MREERSLGQSHYHNHSANEIIVNNYITSGLVAHAALDQGITKVISEWLTVYLGDELYKILTPSTFINHTIVETLSSMKQQHGCIVPGVQRKAVDQVISNPPADYVHCSDDQLIIVCAERPNIS